MPTQKVPFTVQAGDPVTLKVTGADGKPYEVRLAVAVFEVFDSGPGPSGRRGFEVRANVAIDVKPVGEG